MRPFARRAFNLLSVLSLLLFAAVAVLWVQSHRGGLLVGRMTRRVQAQQVVDREWGLFSQQGELGVALNGYRETLANWTAYEKVPPQSYDRSGLIVGPAIAVGPYRDGDDLLIEAGFGLGKTEYAWSVEDSRRYAFIPHWFAMLIASALPMLWAWKRVRMWLKIRRQKPGLCAQCGYDLRATPDRCPECGHVRAAIKD